jgi:hypothetical protein
MKTFIILLLTFGIFEANAKTETKAQPQRNPASATESAGNCSLIDVAAVQGNDHSCSSGSWVATRSGDKILFCCQYQDKY